MTALSAFAVFVGVATMATVSCAVLERLWPRDALSEPLRCAAFLIMTFAAIYVEVVLSGAVSLFFWPLLGAINVAMLGVLLWRDRGALAAMARLSARTLALPFAGRIGLGDRALIAWLLLVVVVEGVVPKSVGDDVDYHLPNIMQMVRSGATLQVVSGHGTDLTAATSYYVRGYEAILAFFFLGPSAQVGAALCALAALAIVYFCLLDFSRQPYLARALVFFLSTGLMFGMPYKGDLLLGALSLFVMTMLIRHRRSLDVAAVPLLSALMLLMALKSSTLMLVALALVLTVGSLRSVWSPARIAAALLVTGALGLAFYLGNLAYEGSPLFPYRVVLFGKVLFDGPATLDVLSTSLLGNLDAGMILPFARGLVRTTSPLAVLAIPLLVGLVYRYFQRSVLHHARRTALGFLAVGAATFVLTPFSDNAGVPHSQLYSGHTIRMALPLVLLSLALASAVVGGWPARASTRAAHALAIMGVVNIVWYDIAALALKPANAFAGYAPLFHTFDPSLLAAGFASMACFAFAASYVPQPLAFAGALSIIAIVRPILEVSSYAYSPGFRSLGQRSHIVETLTRLADPSKVVSVLLADGPTGPLRGVITTALYRGFHHFELARSPGEAIGRDVVVVPSVVRESFGGFVHGRIYAIKRPVHALQTLTEAGYVSLFEDSLYTVLARR